MLILYRSGLDPRHYSVRNILLYGPDPLEPGLKLVLPRRKRVSKILLFSGKGPPDLNIIIVKPVTVNSHLTNTKSVVIILLWFIELFST